MRPVQAFALLSAWLCAGAAAAPPALAERALALADDVAADAPPVRYPFAPGREHADDFAPFETAGPALSLGAGELYAGYGVDLAYVLVPARERPLAIAPHVTLGYRPGASGFAGKTGVRGGAMLAYGGERRFLLDVAFGALETRQLWLHGLPAASRVVTGVSVAIGVERMDVLGLFARALIGANWLTARAVPDGDRFGLLLGVGLGWKPW